MTRRGWALFLAMCLVWGLPYLFIRIAVESVSPAALVFARTGLAAMILLPIAATIVQLAVSRSREFGADDTGAEVSGDPLALASALRKMEAHSKQIPLAVSPSASHLFIVQPLLPGGFTRLFSTHPPIEERIRLLRAM